MIKNTFIYVVLVIFIGFGVWFFMQKAQNNNGSIDTIVDNSPSPTATPTASTTADQGTTAGNGTWVKLDGGLEYQDVTIGNGDEAKQGDMIATNYTGTLSDGTKFDSSYDRGQPFAFILGGGMVIKGWDVGIVGMKVGGKRKLIIPPTFGYGNNAQGSIPANSTLFFEVELLAVQAQGK